MTHADSSRSQATAALGAADQAFDGRDFRNALGCFGTGVTVITAATADGRRAGLTCNSFASVSLNPPLVLWSLVVHSPSMTLFQEASHFAVNVLGASQADLALRFARPAEDKFAGVFWRPGLGNAPVLADTVATFECRNAYRYYGGDHVIFLGSVEAYAYNRGEPLLFSRGTFGSFVPAAAAP
jgi:flavin reductase (DIM6/NTAB) family NADH-FMN oxidoreductase RutF